MSGACAACTWHPLPPVAGHFRSHPLAGASLDHLEQKLPLPGLEGLPDTFRELTARLPEVRDDTAWLFDGEPMEEADTGDAEGPAVEGLDGLPELTPVVGQAGSGLAGAPDSAAAGAAQPEQRDEPGGAAAGQPAALVDTSGITGTDTVAVPGREQDDHGPVDVSAGHAADDSSPDAAQEPSTVPAAGPEAATGDAPPIWLMDDIESTPTPEEPASAAPREDAGEPPATPEVREAAPEAAAAPPHSADGQYSADDVAAVVDSQSLRHLLNRLPGAPPDDLDADLAELFREEARELLDSCEQHLATQSDRSQHQVLARELARELHTLKGGARMSGFTAAGDLGHAMESLLEMAALEGRSFDDTELTLIGQCLDRLNQLIFVSEEAVAPALPETQAPAPEPASIAGAAASMDASPAPEPAPDTDTEAAAETAETAPAPLPVAEHGPDWRPESFVPPVPEPEAVSERAVGEFVRVRADQLDSLVNLAGEVGIIRTRMEQQVGAFRFNLEELEQTVQRLRDQLRKLEIEAETQILSREVRVQESGDAHFDPLELDRFSQLQQLSRALAESMSDLQSLQGLLEEHTRLAESLLLQQSRAGAELQEGLMRARMVPFESMLPRLRRLVRQESTELGKRVRLNIEGSHGELDRGVLERMAAPFEHMLRNALVHGRKHPRNVPGLARLPKGITLRVMRQATGW